jgi:hypothetical protein
VIASKFQPLERKKKTNYTSKLYEISQEKQNLQS